MPERYLGKTLGKYRVDELIGSGGFAWVYRGFDPELEIPVALKVLKPQFAGDPAFEERFRREASTAAKLRHPNIVKIYAVGRDGDAVYFAMDYLPSGLADKLEATPHLPEELVVRLGIDVARALGFAHREGVVHRDIKVDNILFDTHGNAVVADFGIARAVSGYTNQTGTNMVVGTPQYFAPEQARAKPLDGRADIYSLGVSLYRAATGRLPFEGDDWYEIARQHVEETPPSPRSINPQLSPTFEHVILRCLAKHPDDRPATGEQLADELTAVLGTRRDVGPRAHLRSPSETPTLVTPLQLVRSAKGWRRIAPATVMVVALAATAIALATRQQAPATPVDTGGGAGTVADSATTSLPPAESLAVTSDTLALPLADSADEPGAGRDSVRPRPAAAPTVGRLVVTAPPNARLSLNGLAIADGSWRSDSLKPGEYVLSATVPAAAACSWATAEERVRVRAGAVASVTLSPRPCGTLAINLLNAAEGARLLVTSTDGSVRHEGALPLASPVVLPVGQYRVSVNQPLCAPYVDESVSITANNGTTLTFRLICERP